MFLTVIRLYNLRNNKLINVKGPNPVAARSKARICGHSLAGIAGSNPPRAWISASFECCVLSGGGLCDGPIARPEESYRGCVSGCVIKCDQMHR